MEVDATQVMTNKDLILELYRDMKVVRPAVEALLAAGVIARIEKLEDERKTREAAGVERSRLGSLTNRGIAIFVVVGNFVIGSIVVIANFISN